MSVAQKKLIFRFNGPADFCYVLIALRMYVLFPSEHKKWWRIIDQLGDGTRWGNEVEEDTV
jgi:hypothetical protein